MWNEQFVDKHGKKKYRYYEKYKDPMTNKWRRVSVVLEKNTKTSQKEAQRLLDKKVDEKIMKLQHQFNQEIKNITLEQVIDEWFEQFKLMTNPKFNTIHTYSSIIKFIKRDINTSILIDKITLPFIQKEFNKLNKRDIAATTRRKTLSLFKRMLKYAKKQYGINIDYVDDIEISKKNPPKSKEYLELDELYQIITYLKNVSETSKSFFKRSKYKCGYCFIAVQSKTGLRAGEMSALREENISFEDMTIEVNGTIQWVFDENHKFGLKSSPKTAKSNRIVTIDSKTKNYIELRLKDLNELKRVSDKYLDRGFIFTSVLGKPLSVDDINHLLKEACNACGISKHITSHSLRHTHISLLAQLGVPIKAIMDRVGHTDHKTTLEVYTHVTNKMEKDLVSKLETLKI